MSFMPADLILHSDRLLLYSILYFIFIVSLLLPDMASDHLFLEPHFLQLTIPRHQHFSQDVLLGTKLWFFSECHILYEISSPRSSSERPSGRSSCDVHMSSIFLSPVKKKKIGRLTSSDCCRSASPLPSASRGINGSWGSVQLQTLSFADPHRFFEIISELFCAVEE